MYGLSLKNMAFNSKDVGQSWRDSMDTLKSKLNTVGSKGSSRDLAWNLIVWSGFSASLFNKAPGTGNKLIHNSIKNYNSLLIINYN